MNPMNPMNTSRFLGVLLVCAGCEYNGANTSAPATDSTPTTGMSSTSSSSTAVPDPTTTTTSTNSTTSTSNDLGSGSESSAQTSTTGTTSDTSSTGVPPRFCGDGIIQDPEECDNGSDNNNEGGYNSCTEGCLRGPHCGDMEKQDEEECDDGTPIGDDLCVACENAPRRYIFVTSLTRSGQINGVIGADALCKQTAGNLGGLNSEWIAWLSDNVFSVAGRVDDQSYFDWYALPGEPPLPVAKGWSGLTSGALVNAINRTENGGPLPPGALVWSNTNATDAGMLDGAKHCDHWNSQSGDGRVGDPSMTTVEWTAKSTPEAVSCDQELHLYCVQVK